MSLQFAFAIEYSNPALDREIELSSGPLKTQLDEIRTRCKGITGLSVVDTQYDHQNQSSKKFKYYFQHVINENSLPTIVYINGGPGGSGMGWNDEDSKNFNWIHLDPRGLECNFGTEIDFPKDIMTTSQHAHDILEVIKSLKLTNYIVHGHSYGTVVATHIGNSIWKNQFGFRPNAILLEGTLGIHLKDINEYSRNYIDIANLFFDRFPNQKSLFSSSDPLDYGKYFWGSYFFIVGHAWKETLKELGQLQAYLSGEIPNPPEEIVQAKQSFDENPPTYEMIPEGYEKYLVTEIMCQELSPTLGDIIKPKLDTGVATYDILKYGTACANIPFVHPYDSAQLQTDIPLVYINGTVDPATPFHTAKYHYDNQKLAPKTFVTQIDGGHGPTYEMAPCLDQVYNQVLTGKPDFSDILNTDGYCRYVPKNFERKARKPRTTIF
ncbi:MAG: alpha/beta hydrolase [Bdellovibrionales bacterium]